jgi:hypothetical protein
MIQPLLEPKNTKVKEKLGLNEKTKKIALDYPPLTSTWKGEGTRLGT